MTLTAADMTPAEQAAWDIAVDLGLAITREHLRALLGAPRTAPCICGHGVAMHDIAERTTRAAAKGTRTQCFHIDGPRGTRCPCKVYSAAVR